ncbi:uncharacterized protein NP_3364A [Natronomonas pharaonis DSM 2160]|uniref:Uncharacterized protein n=2 Tax=Natronomonas pharaonis TaxID=2257 RepID=A0A1U7EX93_NATPD|nr:uncharacterized protein NP_3364A [Natronomonas pharaonis DSM 2160]
MGVRPPQANDDEEPEIIAFGIAALDEYLEQGNVTFPATDEELRRALGDPDIPYDAKGHTISFGSALERAGRERFENRQQFMNALHPVFEAERERTNNSFVGRVRSLLPF